ncbi:hypothetical protein [Aeromonas phage Akh-2]|nr:hypothetical protein [Aeromonas phage Akh-2]
MRYPKSLSKLSGSVVLILTLSVLSTIIGSLIYSSSFYLGLINSIPTLTPSSAG